MSSVDIIVPCYRYGRFLRQCVESVLTQSFQNVRILIIDDASPDNTAEVAADLARSDSRVTFLQHAANKGHIDTYNEGIEWASADYMSILSADDYLLPGALSRVVNLLDSHPEVGLAFGRGFELKGEEPSSFCENSAGAFPERPWRIVRGLEFIELSGARNIVSTPTAVTRTALQKRVGGYRRELPHAGDMEMWLRLAAHASVGMLESYQAVYRRHSSNMSLKYTEARWLPDLQQRKAAFDIFFETCERRLSNGRRVRERVFRQLARDAISFASTAFNKSESEFSDQLMKFAAEICPSAKRSLPWIKLACKRGVGFKVWRAVEPIVARMRERNEIAVERRS